MWSKRTDNLVFLLGDVTHTQNTIFWPISDVNFNHVIKKISTSKKNNAISRPGFFINWLCMLRSSLWGQRKQIPLVQAPRRLTMCLFCPIWIKIFNSAIKSLYSVCEAFSKNIKYEIVKKMKFWKYIDINVLNQWDFLQIINSIIPWLLRDFELHS